MNEDIASGKWKQIKGAIKQKWGELTDDEIDHVDGSAERFAGLLEERYGLAREQAEKEFEALRSL